MRGLADKVVVVAGGATGIGAATATRLAQEGASVVVGDVNVARAQETAERIAAEGGQAIAVEFDISHEESVRGLIAAAVERFGGLDGVHCNAADLSEETFGRDTDVVSVDADVWHRTLAVDLTGYFFTARHAVPELLKRGGGAIVNTSSVAAFSGDVQKPAYAVAKAGITALTRHVASRWGKEGVRCNAVAPGLTLSEAVLSENRPGWREQVLAAGRSPRLGQPEDTAALVAFLLSDDGSWINGQVYGVDGGFLLR